MKKALFLALVLLAGSLSSTVLADKKKPKKAEPVVAEPVTKLVTPSDSVSYVAGYSATDGLLGYLIGTLHVDTAYMSEFVRGYMDAYARKLFQTRSLAARDLRNKVYREENEAWLKSNATKPGVVVLPSGLQYKVLKEGDGAMPKATDQVKVVYEGETIDDNVFDATSRHGDVKFDTFRCDQVIKGWTEALTKMKVGSKWEVFIPQNLAYGASEAGQIKPYSTLIFTVELVGISDAVAAEPAPKAEAPAGKKPAKDKGKRSSRK